MDMQKQKSSQLSTKIWSMACDWEALLKSKASTDWIDNPQINCKERGSADVKQTEFLLIMQQNRIAKFGTTFCKRDIFFAHFSC